MLMKDSKMSEAWIVNNVARNPWQKTEDGFYRSCPLRIAFPHVFRPQEPDRKRKGEDDGEKTPTYNLAGLLPPGGIEQVNSVLWPVWVEMCRKEFPNNWDSAGNQVGLNWPFYDCQLHADYKGYTPGLFYFGTSTQFRPQIVDVANNPITDEARVYSGVWGLITVNCYTYKNRKKGAAFGLQTLMIIGDDDPISGGGQDIKKAFAGVNVDAAYDPSRSFSQIPAQIGRGSNRAPPPPAPGGGMMPAPQHVAAPPPGPPRGYAAAPPAPPPAAAPGLGYNPLED